jgi:hypothetical protein|tara:strand:+ start:427 stop:612 length:186 start_codon:yes stop_codon:yes gene_type:complete
MNCAHCNKAFTCGCQKLIVEGITIHKTCKNEYNNKVSNPADVTRELGLDLAKEQIKNLRNT